MKKILVLGAGTIGKTLADHPQFELVARKDFDEAMLADVDALVNCAAITGYGKCKQAGFNAVMEANVALPVKLRAMCKRNNTRLFQPSTSGVYKQQTCANIEGFKYAAVGDLTFPHNLYCASKLLMEQQLASETEAVVLRLPWFLDPEDMKKRAQNWDYVQHTWTSFFEISELQRIILAMVEQDIEYPSLMNVSSGVIYFPDFIEKLLNRKLKVKSEHAPDMTSAIPIIAPKIPAEPNH